MEIKNKDGKILIQLPPAKAVECPDFGEILVRPYISGGATSAFRKHEGSHHASLNAVLGASIEGAENFDFARLTVADKKEIALFLAKSLEIFDEFRESLESNALEDAFYEAFTKSETYLSRVKQDKQLASYFAREKKLQIAIHGIFDVVRQATKFTTMVDSTSFLNDSVARLDLHASMIHRIGLRQNLIVETLESATQHIKSFESVSQQISGFANLQLDFGVALSTIADIRAISTPLPQLFEKFNVLESHLRGFQLSDLVFRDAASAIESANSSVQAVNQFFGNIRRPSYWPADEETEEFKDDVERVETADLEARYLLHEESADLILVGNDAVDLISERFEQCVENVVEARLEKYKQLFERMNLLANPKSFLEVLHDFSELVRREHWKRFWQEKGNKFVASPEALANTLLSVYLGGRWHGTAFVGNELANGDGFMDIVVNFLGLNNVVELKMVGAGWGIGYAESGIAQLDQYMANYEEDEAFLVVFDGRKTTAGRKLKDKYVQENGTVNVVTIPIFFEPPTRK